MDERLLPDFYSLRKRADGFTLIELLVVVVIIGIIAAIAAPELLKQVEKGRQTEAKSALGTINRAQQAYRVENATFTTLSRLSVKISNGQYYDIDDDPDSYGDPDPFGAAQRARAKTVYDNDIRNYASAVGQTANGTFEAVICEATSPTDDNVFSGNNSGDVFCPGGPGSPGGPLEP